MISIIIPLYNAQKTIELVLEAIILSKFNNSWELIIVDDGSTDTSVSKIQKIQSKYKLKNLKLLTQKHQGPAAARNLGVRKAKGEILVFLDADVVLEPKTLNQINYDFDKDKNLAAINGVYSIQPANPSFFTSYFSFFKYYQWVYRNTKEYSGFSTRLAAIRKNIFLELGSFNEKYKGALVEDYEFGYRLGKKYKVLVDPKVLGKHFHPNFYKCFKNYYERTYLWLKLFKKRRQFDTITTTSAMAIGSCFGCLSLISLPLLMFYSVSILFTIPFWVSLLVFLWFYRQFLFFVFSNKGLLWMIVAIMMSLVLTIPLGLAGFRFLFVDKLTNRKTTI